MTSRNRATETRGFNWREVRTRNVIFLILAFHSSTPVLTRSILVKERQTTKKTGRVSLKLCIFAGVLLDMRNALIFVQKLFLWQAFFPGEGGCGLILGYGRAFVIVGNFKS